MAVMFIYGLLLLYGISEVTSRHHHNCKDGTEISANLRAETRIIGGWNAVEGQFPHQVQVRMVNATGQAFGCGGSVIEHRWVLTAAHCLANFISYTILYGVTNVNRPTMTRETTQAFFFTPYYNVQQGGAQTHDIALLRVEEPVVYGNTIRPIRLQSSKDEAVDYTRVRFTVSGFGENDGTASQDLMWVHMIGISLDECRRLFSFNPILHITSICAESYNRTIQSPCPGDSGGAVTVVDNDGEITMVGIVSFGHISGCDSGFPAVSVRPGYYHDFLTTTTGLNFDWEGTGRPPPTVAPTTAAPTTDAPISTTTPKDSSSIVQSNWMISIFIVTIMLGLR